MKAVSILGCGWLGLPLAKHFIEKGFEIKGSTTSVDKISRLESLGILPFLVDINTIESSDKAFLSSEILIVAITSKNIDSFKKLVSEIETSTIKKVIFISSTSVYPNSDVEITEAHKTLETPLVSIERLLLSNTNFNTTIVRFGGLIGEYRNPGNFFKNGRIIKNPEGVVNMIHQEDCIEIIDRIIEKGIETEIFNACTDAHPTRRDFYTKAKLTVGFEVPDFEENQPIQTKIISSKKLKKELNFEFKYANF
jgi:nucleoside-diphosphate-sugar epimerase